MQQATITPQPPYYAVIFTSLRTETDEGYAEMNLKLEEIAHSYSGFIGQDSARSGLGISISYWKNEEDIVAWRKNAEHQLAMKYGKEKWYTWYNVRVAKVEREYYFTKD
jgi:heme-degrading monooxygenase HmoA